MKNTKMSARQIQKMANRFFHDWQKLDAAAKLDPALKSFAEQLYKVQDELRRAANGRLLKLAERKDRGDVLWTVYQPIILGAGPDQYVGGMREIVRTAHRRKITWFWRNDNNATGDWTLPDDYDSPESDFVSAMHEPRTRKAAA